MHVLKRNAFGIDIEKHLIWLWTEASRSDSKLAPVRAATDKFQKLKPNGYIVRNFPLYFITIDENI